MSDIVSFIRGADFKTWMVGFTFKLHETTLFHKEDSSRFEWFSVLLSQLDCKGVHIHNTKTKVEACGVLCCCCWNTGALWGCWFKSNI